MTNWRPGARERDKEVDELEEGIDQLAIRLLATQPMAIDLRIVAMSLLQTSNDLESTGDYANDIAKRAIRLSSQPLLKPLGHPEHVRDGPVYCQGCSTRLSSATPKGDVGLAQGQSGHRVLRQPGSAS
ncbi:MAG: PhoU domain-containing protein [Geminicoccaceae bacterium]